MKNSGTECGAFICLYAYLKINNFKDIDLFNEGDAFLFRNVIKFVCDKYLQDNKNSKKKNNTLAENEIRGGENLELSTNLINNNRNKIKEDDKEIEIDNDIRSNKKISVIVLEEGNREQLLNPLLQDQYTISQTLLLSINKITLPNSCQSQNKKGRRKKIDHSIIRTTNLFTSKKN